MIKKSVVTPNFEGSEKRSSFILDKLAPMVEEICPNVEMMAYVASAVSETVHLQSKSGNYLRMNTSGLTLCEITKRVLTGLEIFGDS